MMDLQSHVEIAKTKNVNSLILMDLLDYYTIYFFKVTMWYQDEFSKTTFKIY